MDFFAEDALENRREFITGFYHDGVEKIKERETYLSPNELDTFVTGTIEAIIKLCEEYLCELLEK